MATTYRIYAAGGGDFTTLQACMDDAEVQATTGNMIWEFFGDVGVFNDLSSNPLTCDNLIIQPKAGSEASATAPSSTATIGTGGTRSVIGAQLANNVNSLTIKGTILGKVLVTRGGGGSLFQTVVIQNCYQNITNALAGATQYGLEVQDGGNADGSTQTLTLANFVQTSVAQTSATNWSGVRVNNTGFASTVNVYQCSMNETAVKGSGAGILIAHTGTVTTILDARNSGIIGTSLSVTKTGSGTLTYAGTCSGNRTTDVNASLGTVSGVTTAAWKDVATGDFNLPAGSALINVASTTPVPLDINGAARPRAGNIVDGGVVNYAPPSTGGDGSDDNELLVMEVL